MEKVQTSPSLLTCLSAWLPSGIDYKEKSNTTVTASAVKDCDRPKKKKAQNETTDKEASETQVVHKKRKTEIKQKKKPVK
ncbi:p21-activated protein kinase-interacting protein 1-like [Xenopus laevis]|uniref:P21-activated protein kinase-interacting protein 1-like n=1 Tax=Xenopus laevis TaxID=8355 RepID=A0A8J1L2A5_XENLA|nr:p21-activated protein kinase-interacting protein 1-like [Xenopus laevis]